MLKSLKIATLILLLIPFSTQIYKNVSWIDICKDNFIGANYSHKLEKPCRSYWAKWTAEIMQSFNVPNQ